MVTTGELRAIIEELQLVDIGDAASYLGEEAMVGEELGPYSDCQRTASYASRQAIGEASLVPAVTGQAAAFSVPMSVEEVNGIGAFSMSAQ